MPTACRFVGERCAPKPVMRLAIGGATRTVSPERWCRADTDRLNISQSSGIGRVDNGSPLFRRWIVGAPCIRVVCVMHGMDFVWLHYQTFSQERPDAAGVAGNTGVGLPFCHCTMHSSAPTRRPFSSYCRCPSGKNRAGPSFMFSERIASATFCRSATPARSIASLRISVWT